MPTTPRRFIPIYIVMQYSIQIQSNLSCSTECYLFLRKIDTVYYQVTPTILNDALEFVIQSNVGNDPAIVIDVQKSTSCMCVFFNSSILDYLVQQL